LSRPAITSTSNLRIKHAVRLRESSRERRRAGETIVDGAKEILRAANAGIVPTNFFLATNYQDLPEVSTITQLLTDRHSQWRAVVQLVDQRIFHRIGFGDRDEGCVATIRLPAVSLNDLQPKGDGPVLILEGIEKPGNVGAMLRSVDGAGASAAIFCDPLTDIFNPAAIRASLGCIFSVPIGAGSVDEVQAWLQARSYRIVTARVSEGLVPWRIDLTGPLAVVVGNESRGLSDRWQGLTTQTISIPMLGVADSLNVSVTASVILFEALRQRTFH
jgi:TrmH family RNA methyltransferase